MNINDDKFLDLMNEAIDKLASDSISEGVEAMVSISIIVARAGISQMVWSDLRKHIIQSAELKAPVAFIKEKVILAERELHERRTGEKRAIYVGI